MLTMLANDLSNETKRLEALYRYGLLDTPAEEAFDCITRLAKSALDVPIALIVLVDKDRQWFKSKQGTRTLETTRDVSFCSRTIQGDKPLLISNLKKDPLFMKNPLVCGFPFLRFYSGVPLRTLDGFNIGSLCVLGFRSRTLNSEEVSTLIDLARLTMDQIELRHIADIDYLTGLATRHVLIKAGNKEVGQASSSNRPLSLVVFEIDRFSEISRKDGYNITDSLLQALTNKCKEIIGVANLFARVGDGRFAILMPDITEATALELTQKITAIVKSLDVFELAVNYKLTSSSGVATYMPDDKDFNHLLTRAEIVLQKNKKETQSLLGNIMSRIDEGATVSYGTVDTRS